MRRIFLLVAAGLTLVLAAQAQEDHFIPDHLVVLRAGDGVVDLTLRQSPVFLDQFAVDTPNATPTFTVRISTNGPHSFFINGHAASEGNLTRSANHKLLTFAGYGSNLLQVKGTASRLNIPRGFAAVDASGTVHTYLYKSDMPDAKVNPRGAVTDGSGAFWGCGNAYGTIYYDSSKSNDLVRFTAMPNSRAIAIINDILYASINAADSFLIDQPAGIYSFQPDALPRRADATPTLFVAAAPEYKRTVGFDMNPAATIAYMSDTSAGVQKYVKTEGKWSFAYNFSIPQNIPKAENNATGCFGLVVDFSRAAPVIYATTTEGYGGSVNSNRVVRIVDTNSTALVLTVAQAGSTNIAYRGIALAPD